MTTLIKINLFSWCNTDLSEDVEEYLDDMETAALSWDLTITAGIVEANNKSKIGLFHQNRVQNGDAFQWWYYVLSEGIKKTMGRSSVSFGTGMERRHLRLPPCLPFKMKYYP